MDVDEGESTRAIFVVGQETWHVSLLTSSVLLFCRLKIHPLTQEFLVLMVLMCILQVELTYIAARLPQHTIGDTNPGKFSLAY